MRKLKVLIASRSRESAEAAQSILKDNPLCRTELRVVSNGHVDPLDGIAAQPDLLLLHDYKAQGELRTLATIAPEDRPALVVFGPAVDTQSIRLAMRAGARDYLSDPLVAEELNGLIAQVADDLANTGRADSGSLNVFINGKGGSGATFLATNIAHGLACSDNKVTLIDLDLQFAGLCRYLDIDPAQDLFEALQAVANLDDVAAEAFTSKHDSGLRLLSARTEHLHLNSDISPEALIALLRMYQSFNDYVIVDLPRNIDLLGAAVLESADRITLVMQQSFPHLHDTARLLQILREDMGIDDSQVTVVVNRYEKDSAILLKDIENALRVDDIVRIPNHYRLTAESVNSGIPLTEVNRKASVARSLQDLHQRISGFSTADEGPLARALPGLFRR